MGLGEKKQAVMRYNSQGLKLRLAFAIAGITRHQYYYRARGGKRGRKVSSVTPLIKAGQVHMVSNQQVIDQIKESRKDPDLVYGYIKTNSALQYQGYIINPKKTNRLMSENNLLKEKAQKSPKTYVQYRKVAPQGPLEVLEMDIKMVWVEQDRRHAFVLNIIDTFTRKWLWHSVGFSITQHQVKEAWQHIIMEYLQPADLLKKSIHIEIRNDNDKRFSAKMVQEFFEQNHLNQVFAHPYTPQENGHVESFHAILSTHLKRFTFWNLPELEQNLILFMEKYNNQRLHGSIAYLCPNDFEKLWHLGHIQMSSKIRKRKIVFKLKIPPRQISQYTGNDESEGSSLHNFPEPPDKVVEEKLNDKEITGANISNNLRSKESPSVVPCTSNVKSKNHNFNTL